MTKRARPGRTDASRPPGPAAPRWAVRVRRPSGRISQAHPRLGEEPLRRLYDRLRPLYEEIRHITGYPPV